MIENPTCGELEVKLLSLSDIAFFLFFLVVSEVINWQRYAQGFLMNCTISLNIILCRGSHDHFQYIYTPSSFSGRGSSRPGSRVRSLERMFCNGPM